MAATIHVNDIGTAFRLTLVDQTGAIINISSATQLQIILEGPDQSIQTKTAEFYTDGTDGIMQYLTLDGDLNLPGRWQIQGKVTLTGGTWHTDVTVFKISANLA